MPRVRLEVKPPGAFFAFTERHPDAEFAIRAAYPTDEALLVILSAAMDDPETFVAFLEASPVVRDLEVRHTDADRVVVSYALSFVPPPVRAVFEAGELPRFPVRIANGRVVAELTTSHERISRFKDALESTGVPFEVLSLTQRESSVALLTDRQRAFVEAALEHGYYDTPRRCTLTGLAETLDVSTATASTVLHRAEETIVKAFFDDGPIPTGAD